jgi:hypothetical protein
LSPSAIDARAGHAACPQLDLESLRHLELVDRDFARRRLGHLAGERRELRVSHGGGLALVPCGRRRRLVLRLRSPECEQNCRGESLF